MKFHLAPPFPPGPWRAVVGLLALAGVCLGQGQLTIQDTHPGIILRWDGTNYVLESASGLGSPVNWTNAGLSVISSGTSNTVSVTAFGPQQFYRLRQVSAGGSGQVSGSLYVTVASNSTVLLPNMSVFLRNPSNDQAVASAQTDLNGTFVFPVQPFGNYQLCWTAPGIVPGCTNLTIDSETVDADEIAVTPSGNFVFGQVALGQDSHFARLDSFFQINVAAQVWIENALHQVVSGPVSANNSGMFFLSNVPDGSYTLLTVCEGTNSKVLLQVPGIAPVNVTLSNSAPVIQTITATQNGGEVRQVAGGSTVRLSIQATDADNDLLTYHWFPSTSTVNFTSSNSPSIDWQLPFVEGVHNMYVAVSDGKGGYATDKISISTDASALFSGRVTSTLGGPVSNAVVFLNFQQNTVTMSDGYYELPGAQPAGRYTLTVFAAGYYSFQQSYDSERPNNDVQLIPAAQCTFPAQGNGVCQDSFGSLVAIPANSLVDSQGQLATGMVTLTMGTRDPCNPQYGLLSDASGVDSLGVNVALNVYAAMDVIAQDAAGRRLSLAPGSVAFVSMRLGTSCGLVTNPPSARLWVYNPAGYWQAQTQVATNFGSAYQANISQLGSVAVADATNNFSCILLVLDNSINRPAHVRIVQRTRSDDFVITEKETRFAPFLPNVTPTFVLLGTNGLPLSCASSNSVNSGPGGPVCAQVNLKLDLGHKGSEFLAYKFGDGDAPTAAAYYQAIDPATNKNTLEKWKQQNGFSEGGVLEAMYFNDGDLGFGRYMQMKRRGDDIAYSVCNYGSADAAVAARTNAAKGLAATVSMEYSASPTGGVRFTKFYLFNNKNERVDKVDLDGNGEKFVPNLCVVCHGGQLFDKDKPGTGNIAARFLPFDLDSFHYSGSTGFGRQDEEANFKIMNTNLLATGATPVVQDLLTGWYGGAGLPSAAFDGSYLPAGWDDTQAHRELYRDAFKVSCRACHSTRTEVLSFDTFVNFIKKKSRINATVCDLETMPNAQRTFNIFWGSRCLGPTVPDQPQMLNTNLLGLKCP